MPVAKINTEQALSAIAHTLENMGIATASELLEDPMALDRMLEETTRFDWDQAGRLIHATRQQMYRWYHDTYQRHLYGNVSDVDMKIIRDELSAAVRLGRKLDQEFQRYLKQKLGQQYHRNSFTVAFNNTKRIVLAGLQRESQSISYSSASVDSVKQER